MENIKMLKMKWLLVFSALLISLPTLALSAKHVVVISVDGLRPDAISKEHSPHIDELRQHGLWASNAQTIMPSITLPSHTSMLTGVDVPVHQVTWNSYIANKGIVKVPTSLELAHQSGKTTAMFVGKEKFKHLKRAGSLNHFDWPGLDAAAVAKSFVQYVDKKGLPNLVFIHLPDTDTAGHSKGWMTKEYFAALKDVDDAIEKIMAAIRKSKATADATVILTADPS
jgi:predicted AlkP superfamily pyrophosphatase or phosphodiesterase